MVSGVTGMANKVTDPALLRLLESSDTPSAPSGIRVTDPALLAQLEAPEAAVAMVPEFDPMGNATGGMVPAAPAASMSYGEQMRKVGGLVDDGVRLAANGMSFGMADRLAGASDALTGQAPSYSAGVDAQHARTQALREAAPVASGVAEAVGGLATGAGLIRNGVTLAGRVGSGIVPRVLGFGAEGAAYGAASGAGNTYTGETADYLHNAGEGIKMGGGIGMVMPVLGSAAGALWRGGSAVAGRNVDGVGRAGSAAMRMAAQADEAGLRALPSMGPEAMLPDAGPSMLGLAQGAATGNGPGKSALVNALRERDAGTGQRLANVVEQSIGPAPIPSRIEAGLVQGRRALSPEYERALEGARAVDTAPLAAQLETLAVDARGPALRALREVRTMLDIPGNPGNLDPSPRALLNVRQAIDGQMAGESNTNVLRVLGDARQAVDAELARNIPGIKAVDARFGELARQSEGLQRGGQIFDTGKTATRPVEMTEEMVAGATPRGELVGPSGEAFRIRQGVRAEIDRIVGTKVNDLTAMERTLGTPQDWNAQKAATVFGQDNVDAIVQAIQTNRTFRNSLQRIAQGSDTAARSEGSKLLEAGDGFRPEASATGIAVTAFQKVAKALMGANSQATKDQVAATMASPRVREITELLLRQAETAGAGARSVTRVLANPAYLGGASASDAGRK
jgi:hypothetical protein